VAFQSQWQGGVATIGAFSANDEVEASWLFRRLERPRMPPSIFGLVIVALDWVLSRRDQNVVFGGT
jgi:hypothetical protein